ncbi:magnesium chelatase [Sulfobacillus sp. hq2]|nr:magnesium chelatase [Sulfobacillus sp. hq2]
MNTVPIFPLAAIVGQDTLKLALSLNAIAPAIGGVLIQGERGNAKSTTVRAFSDILPRIAVRAHCPYHCDPASPFSFCSVCQEVPTGDDLTGVRAPIIDLPIGATEDRVLGHLDLEHVLQNAHQKFVPGLLARAHRGILYVDEVNLLDDQLIDLLLDAAASGMVHVERDGFSLTYPARFILVGTMNPEEGELRPQLLDRFGLSVDITTPQQVEERMEIAERRLDFHRNPQAFLEKWTEQTHWWETRIAEASQRLTDINLGRDILRYITQKALDAHVEGVRADLVMAQAAQAYTAWRGGTTVTEEDVEAISELVLAHRRRPAPPGAPRPHPPQDTPPQGGATPTGPTGFQSLGAGPSQNPPPERVVRSQNFTGEMSILQGAWPKTERRSVTDRLQDKPRRLGQPYGRLGLGARRQWPQTTKSALWVHWPLTITQALRRGVQPFKVLGLDLSFRAAKRRSTVVFVFVLDTSASMASIKRLGRVKGAVAQAAQTIYLTRSRFAVLAFGRGQATVLLTPTHKKTRLQRVLDELPAGGNTPLWDGLSETAEHLRRWREKHAWVYHVVLITDGKVAGLSDTPRTLASAARCRHALRQSPVVLHVIDAEIGRTTTPWAKVVAQALQASYRTLEDWAVRRPS